MTKGKTKRKAVNVVGNDNVKTVSFSFNSIHIIVILIKIKSSKLVINITGIKILQYDYISTLLPRSTYSLNFLHHKILSLVHHKAFSIFKLYYLTSGFSRLKILKF